MAKLRPLHLICIALAVLALVVFGQVPGGTRLSQVIQNAAHAPAFFILAFIVLALIRDRRLSSRTWRICLAAFAVCILLGIGIEIFQALIGSDASPEDVLTDAVGTVVGLAAAAYLRARKPALLLACLAGLSIAAAPVVWACAAYINRGHHFPVLAAFHSPLDLYFFKQQTPPLQITPNGSLHVRLPKGPWPGVTLEEPAPDWSGYRALVVELTNPEDKPLSLTLRIHDRHHNQEMDDRYNRRFDLPPHSRHRLQIPLTDLHTAPRTRRMDMKQVAGIIIFASRESAGRSFYLDEIRLQ